MRKLDNVFKLIKIKTVSFSVDHNDIFDHKYGIYPGNLFSMLKYQYFTEVFLNFKEAL